MEELHKIQLELAELQKRICPELMLLSESDQVPQSEPESDRIPESTLFRVESQLLELFDRIEEHQIEIDELKILKSEDTVRVRESPVKTKFQTPVKTAALAATDATKNFPDFQRKIWTLLGIKMTDSVRQKILKSCQRIIEEENLKEFEYSSESENDRFEVRNLPDQPFIEEIYSTDLPRLSITDEELL